MIISEGRILTKWSFFPPRLSTDICTLSMSLLTNAVHSLKLSGSKVHG